MKKGNFIIIIFGCLLFIGGSVWIYNQYFKEIPELTLKEAAVKGFEVAKKWNPKSTLYRATSIEVEEAEKSSKGKMGKRLKWSFKFCVPNTKKCRYIRIMGDQVQEKNPSFSIFNSDPGVTLNQIQIDSPSLLKKAISQYGLKPTTEGHGEGYHFEILQTDLKKEYVYKVIGQQEDGDAQALYFYLNGKYYGKKFNETN